MKDGNANMLLLWKKYAGLFGIFPIIEMSTDGVHMTDTAMIEFDIQIEDAMDDFPGTVIF